MLSQLVVGLYCFLMLQLLVYLLDFLVQMDPWRVEDEEHGAWCSRSAGVSAVIKTMALAWGVAAHRATTDFKMPR